MKRKYLALALALGALVPEAQSKVIFENEAKMSFFSTENYEKTLSVYYLIDV